MAVKRLMFVVKEKGHLVDGLFEAANRVRLEA